MSFLEKYKDIVGKVNASKFVGLVKAERHNNALRLLEFIKDNGIEGDVVETGVYAGSMSILLCKVIEAEFPDKILYSCDSFCGCQDPTTAPYSYPNEKHYHGLYHFPLSSVKGHFSDLECDMSKVKFIEGYFKDTMPKLKEVNLMEVILFLQ